MNGQGRGNRTLRGSNDPSPGNLPGGQIWYFNPQIFWKEIFSGTHPHVLIETVSGTRYRTVFLLSFITDLWTPRNVALMILTPVKK